MKPHGASDMTQTSVSRFLGSDDRYQGTALDDHDLPVGFLLAYELVRAERASPMMLLYEIEVSEPWRRKGVATAMVNLLRDYVRIATSTKCGWKPPNRTSPRETCT
jgi:GNAT superfamily N-acetyltransferase